MLSWLRTVFRGFSLPDDVHIELTEDERVTAFARITDAALVTTTLGLWVAPRKELATERLSWDRIHRVQWLEPALTITPGTSIDTLAPSVPIVADAAPIEFRLIEPGQVPAQVRSRVTRSIAYSQHHELATKTGVWVIARRIPGLDGLHWSVRFDQVSAANDPVSCAQAIELITDAKAEIQTPE